MKFGVCMIKRIFSFILALIQTTALLVFKGTPTHIISVSEQCAYQKFYGWGTSGAWWAQMVGNSKNDEWVAKYLFDKTDGLGLDIYRYNIGAGEKDNPNSRIGNANTKTESFYVLNKQTGKYEFDFSRDANARRMMDLALRYGAKQIILFCNSPHFSMTKSGQASGGLTSGVSNLPKENYQEFVDYVLTIADHFVAEGYPITYISPINEPQWGWGGDWVGQEGCHYSADEAVALLELFAVTMQKRNTPYKLSAPETGDMSSAQFDYQQKIFDSKILNNYCDTFSGHSYWLDNNEKEKELAGIRFKLLFPNKQFDMTEWCELPCTLDADSIDSGLYMANVIVGDLTLLNAASWQSWVAVNGYGYSNGKIISDGLLRANSDYSEIQFNKRYFAYRQFTGAIETGMKRIKVIDSLNSTNDMKDVAFSGNGKTVIVLVNNSDNAQNIKILGDYTSVQIHITDAADNYALSYSGAFNSSISLGGKSITTLVLSRRAV